MAESEGFWKSKVRVRKDAVNGGVRILVSRCVNSAVACHSGGLSLPLSLFLSDCLRAHFRVFFMHVLIFSEWHQCWQTSVPDPQTHCRVKPHHFGHTEQSTRGETCFHIQSNSRLKSISQTNFEVPSLCQYSLNCFIWVWYSPQKFHKSALILIWDVKFLFHISLKKIQHKEDRCFNTGASPLSWTSLCCVISFEASGGT